MMVPITLCIKGVLAGASRARQKGQARGRELIWGKRKVGRAGVGGAVLPLPTRPDIRVSHMVLNNAKRDRVGSMGA